ncbi:MAG: FtsX-like permease family protein [Bacteroidota bacterium]
MKIDWAFIRRLAWRDSRKNRGRLVLFMSSIILGIAALVAINSFNYNLQSDIDEQAASLLGADLVISGNRPIAEDLRVKADSLPAEQASKQELFSMGFLPEQEVSQFVRLNGLEGNFPFYGQLKTQPADAAARLSEGAFALLDNGFMSQHEVEVGDSIRLGNMNFLIVGRLMNDFASANMAAGFAPPVYISQASLAESGLVTTGSLVNYNYYYKLPKNYAIDEWVKERRDGFRNESLRLQTVEGQKESLSEAFDGLNSFLNLVALVSLLLGCIGVASSVLIYVKTKIPSIAVLRCLGMKGTHIFYVYLLQILSIGGLGVLIGIVLGTLVQLLLPLVFQDFLPLDVTTEISWAAILEGGLIGMVITLLFALVPLLPVRRISPLRILRSSFEQDISGRDFAQWGTYSAIGISLLLFLWYLTGNFMNGLIFTVGLLFSFLILFGVAQLIILGVKRFFPRGWSFVFRQGLANLFRPNNQTSTLLVSIGLGTAILTTLFIIQNLLLANVAQMDEGNQPNVILYGIEKSQAQDLDQLTKDFDMPVVQQVPIVTMRMTGWKGKTKAEWLEDTTRTAERWAFNREIRTTFRDTLDGYEEVLSGSFPRPRASNGDSIFVSLEEGFAESMDVKVGDELSFNVQGMQMTTYVGSTRKVDFTKMRTRFFILFPEGVLENAPQFQVLVTKSPDPSTTADYRTAVVQQFPNVSVVDLSSILDALGDILNKVSYVIQFMAVFSILTGFLVLISSLLLSKLQRIRESVLLRTLGGSSKHLLQITATEYALLGSLAAATGIVIALTSSWLLATFELELQFYAPWKAVAFIFVLVVALIVTIGLLNNREVLRKSPLEVLRREE